MAITRSKKPAQHFKKSAPAKKINLKENKHGNFDPDLNTFDSSLEDLFKSDLKDMLWSENHLISAIPRMIAAAKTSELKKALSNHLKETVQHAVRLKSVFNKLNIPAIPKKCDAMEGLTMSGEHTIENTLPGSPGREIGVINSGIKVEQFEMTCYNGLIKMADKLGYGDAVTVFSQNLQEEMAASEILNLLTEGGSND